MSVSPPGNDDNPKVLNDKLKGLSNKPPNMKITPSERILAGVKSLK